MQGKTAPRLLYGAIALLLVIIGALSYALWQESQTDTVRFSIGEEGVEVSEG